jgi:predicted component of type VI protein secretion system
MTRNTYDFCFLVLTLTGLAGCSSEPSVKPAATPPDKIQGKAQILFNESAAADAAWWTDCIATACSSTSPFKW